ncbi:MAG: deoxyguanosinetriphosphate triphosphohydrolase [Azospirillaceae bacterium]
MLAPHACDPATTRGRLFAEPESASRSVYQRDRDRIIHSGAFRRLKHKTQVFVYHEGDYYRTRLTHSIEVAQITRSICRTLALNEDLGEAVALAHDLGHTPFGHTGEDVLDRLMQPYGGFRHNDQTLRVLTVLEQRYALFDGLNLTWETLEGVAKHNGPLLPLAEGQALGPNVARIDREFPLELDRYASAEAQVAALSDDIAYNNHDIDDGLRAGFFTIDDLLELPLVGAVFHEVLTAHPGLEDRRTVHEGIRRLIDRMVGDLVAESGSRIAALRPASADDIRGAGRPMIAFSAEVERASQTVRRFLFERMYRHYLVNRERAKATRIVEDLFGHFLARPDTLPTEWRHVAESVEETERARLIADYIAGMTDRYALVEHDRLFTMKVRF